jgi:hypothetical protein
MTRRELVTAGALGALSASTASDASGLEAGADAAAQSAELVSAQALREIAREMTEVRRLLQDGLVGPSLSDGVVADVRRQFGIFMRSNQKYPDFCEVGPNVFTDLYDWHVRHRQPLELTRTDNRMSLRFMFTWMILRPEQDPNFIGIPFDRG